MYTFTSIFFSLITCFMFLRMHHVHGSDTMTEKIVISVGCLIFLIQSGLTYQNTLTDKTYLKRLITFLNVTLTVLFAILFFWTVDFNRDSIFSVFLGT